MEVIQAIKSLDPSSVRVDPKCHFDIGNVMAMLVAEKLERLTLPSVLQQRSTWNTLLRSRLIESILLRIPLSTFYFVENASGSMWRVADGVQRLLAIRDYIDDVYALEGLEYFREESNGKLFSELTWMQRRITHTYISIQVIDCACPREVKLNIVKRVRYPEHMSSQDAYRRYKYLGLITEEEE